VNEAYWTLCVQVTRLLTNHAPIEEYCHCFFPQEEKTCSEMNACSYGQAQLEIHDHVLYDCVRYNE